MLSKHSIVSCQPFQLRTTTKTRPAISLPWTRGKSAAVAPPPFACDRISDAEQNADCGERQQQNFSAVSFPSHRATRFGVELDRLIHQQLNVFDIGIALRGAL